MQNGCVFRYRAVERTPEFRRKSRDARIREYFYGPAGDLSPHSHTMAFGQVSIFRVGSGPRAPSSAGGCTSWNPVVTHIDQIHVEEC
jgi:hypothetical protein